MTTQSGSDIPLLVPVTNEDMNAALRKSKYSTFKHHPVEELPEAFSKRLLLNMLFKDFLGMANGDEVLAIRLFIEYITMASGELAFRLGMPYLTIHNACMKRWESHGPVLVYQRP